jgi:hypothetical protein
MKVKEEREKVGLKFNIQKTKIMASDPISSWQIDWHKLQLQNLNMLDPWQNSYAKARQCFKKQTSLCPQKSI